jgi:hypothetical protein
MSKSSFTEATDSFSNFVFRKRVRSSLLEILGPLTRRAAKTSHTQKLYFGLRSAPPSPHAPPGEYRWLWVNQPDTPVNRRIDYHE